MPIKEWIKYNTNADLDWEINRVLRNWKISRTERMIFEEILRKNTDDRKIAKLTSKRNLNRLKSSMVISSNTRYVRNRITHILSLKNNINENSDLEKEFPSIKNVQKFIKSIKRMKKTRDFLIKKLGEIKRNNYRDNVFVTIKYAWIKDKIKVWELKKLLKIYNFNIKSDSAWINNNKVDYKKIAEYAEKYSKKHKEALKWLEWLSINAKEYMWAKERWTDDKSKKLRQWILKLTWLDINKWWVTYAWCAAYIRYILNESWYKTSARRMNNWAASALWLPYFKWHIWIYEWWGKMINWNSWNRVRESYINKNKLVWWILPKYAWLRNKIHFDKKHIPIWAILVFTRWTWAINRAKRLRVKYWNYKNNETSIPNYSSRTNYTSLIKHNKHRDPLSVLRTRH